MKKKAKQFYLQERKARKVIRPLVNGFVNKINFAVSNDNLISAKDYLKDLLEILETAEKIYSFINWED